MRTILLIDDDAIVRRLLVRYLGKRAWRVWEAADGETGLRLARENRPAIVLCDLMLPRLNGFEVCRGISQDPDLANTHLIAISAKAYPKDRAEALIAGAEDFLQKPISPAHLLEYLERLDAATEQPAKLPSLSASGRATSVKFWGVRGSIAAPGPNTAFFGGNTPCVEVRANDQIVILDSGTGIRPLGAALGAEFEGQSLEVTILLTHTHWDHIQGFPFFAPLYNAKNLIRVLGYEGARAGLSKIIAGQMESPHFPIGLQDLPGHITIEELKEMEFCIGSLKVRTTFANHPGICLGYRLETSAGAIVYLPDNEPFLHQSRLQTKATHQSSAQEFVEAQDDKLVKFLLDAEVLILDAQYDLEEYKSHEGWGHACFEDAVLLALRARARTLFLFHHDPNHNDQKIAQMVEDARKLVASRGENLVIEAAREGEGLVLGQGNCASFGESALQLPDRQAVG